jgi:hypothetical protein
MSCPIERRIVALGGAARRALAYGEARVFAAFERSCYVETDAGIACIGTKSIGLGPLNAILDETQTVPRLGSTLRLHFGRARSWTPPRAVPGTPDALWKLWPSRRPREGLAPLVDSPSLVDPRARRAADAFLAWLANGASDPAPDAAAPLIGLGPGLTPAGDDFVVGALIALRALGGNVVAARIAAWALALAERGTGRISRAHLACAAQGEGHEALHALLAAKDDDALETALDALGRVGHSSGWDAAAGALAALHRS